VSGAGPCSCVACTPRPERSPLFCQRSVEYAIHRAMSRVATFTQEAQRTIRLPPTVSRCRLGRCLRFDAMFEWLRVFATWTPFSHRIQTFMVEGMRISHRGKSKRLCALEPRGYHGRGSLTRVPITSRVLHYRHV